MDIIKVIFILAGVTLMAYGYNLLGVAPETALEQVVTKIKRGEIAIILGGLCVVIAMLRKS